MLPNSKMYEYYEPQVVLCYKWEFKPITDITESIGNQSRPHQQEQTKYNDH